MLATRLALLFLLMSFLVAMCGFSSGMILMVVVVVVVFVVVIAVALFEWGTGAVCFCL